MPDMSLKFMALSLGLAPVDFAGQFELERLHVLHTLILKSFFDLYVLEVSRLLQICDQVRNRVGAQCSPLDRNIRPLGLHCVKPNCFGSVDRLPNCVEQAHRISGLRFVQLVNDIYSVPVVVSLLLALQIFGLNPSQLTILLLCHSHVAGNRSRLAVQVIPVPAVADPQQYEGDKNLHCRRTNFAELHGRRANRYPRALILRFGCPQQIDSDHSSSKLLKAKPTATANWPALPSIKSIPEPLVGGAIF